jgi:hypothetical protein
MARNQTNRGRNSQGQFTSGRPWSQRQSDEGCAGSGMNLTTGLLSLAGGLGVGAAMMYLFDPEAGRERRQHAADAARQAMESGGTMLGSAVHTVGETAQGALDSAREYVPSRKSLNRAADSASESAHSWLDSARGYVPDVRSYVPSVHFGRQQRGVSGTTASAAALSALALGVGAMWLFDPNRGRGRRAWIGQKITRCLNETGQFMNATGRHLRNKARGYAHEAGSLAQSAIGSDSAIAERVRAALGHLGVTGSSIGVRCSEGRVCLTGRCAADDVDRVLSTTRGVSGVRGIDNNMEVGDMYSSTPNASNLSA